MTSLRILTIDEVGSDYVRLREGTSEVRINFADDDTFSKEDSAGFFVGLRGKPAAIPEEGPFFIGVDFWRDKCDGALRVVPFNFTVRSVERNDRT